MFFFKCGKNIKFCFHCGKSEDFLVFANIRHFMENRMNICLFEWRKSADKYDLESFNESNSVLVKLCMYNSSVKWCTLKCIIALKRREISDCVK